MSPRVSAVASIGLVPLPELEKHKTVVVRPLSADASKISSRSTEIVTTFLEDPCGHFVLDGLRLDLKTIR